MKQIPFHVLHGNDESQAGRFVLDVNVDVLSDPEKSQLLRANGPYPSKSPNEGPRI